jgi:hypothetical protein
MGRVALRFIEPQRHAKTESLAKKSAFFQAFDGVLHSVALQCHVRTADYESGGREFESLRARQISGCYPSSLGLIARTKVREVHD